MTQLIKHCERCLYRELRNGSFRCISNRDRDSSITDCFIAEAPLRELQKQAKSASVFFAVTSGYIDSHKHESKYWTEYEKSKARISG